MPTRPPSACLTPGCRLTVVGGRYCTACAASQSSCRITLVAGPPCAGKNTYVASRRSPGDLVVDFDALITALGGDGEHDQPERLKPFAFDARDAVMGRLLAGDHDLTGAWVINSAPSRRDREWFRRRGCRVVLVMPDRDVCLMRAEHQRPAGWTSYIDNWYSEYEPGGADEIIRG